MVEHTFISAETFSVYIRGGAAKINSLEVKESGGGKKVHIKPYQLLYRSLLPLEQTEE